MRLEEELIATINKDPDFNAGEGWLGKYNPMENIAASGLWNRRGLDGKPFTEKELQRVMQLAGKKEPADLEKQVQRENNHPKREDSLDLSYDAFRKELEHILENAKNEGHEYVDVVSKELHQKLGGYPGKSHRMPSCCDVMYEMMKSGDRILQAPPKGRGAKVKIRYYLD